jgi:hypothetical protein
MTKPPLPNHNSIDTPRQPWISSPYSLISWWDMEQFSAEEFYAIGEDLGRMAELFSGGDERSLVSEINQRGDLQFRIERILDSCETLDLKVSVACANEFLEKIEDEDFTTGGTQRLFQELSNTIRREMQTVLFFHVPSAQAEFYDKKELFGTKVSGRFPNLQSDIIEAGNCLALGRGTACVFHLMRVMESAVQEFGRVLGILAVDTKNWQNILDEVNKAIKALPSRNSITPALSEAAANLYSVKLAWRNEVMHPKATYTLDEAKDVFRQVKLFMGNLVEVLPPASSTMIQ